MPYATVIDVAGRLAFRGTFTATSIPSATQVVGYIQDSAAQLDQWLLAGGYDSPFDTAIASGFVATSGQILLRNWNVTGAALLVEQAAQQSPNESTYQKMWEEICKTCMDRTIDVPLPMLDAKAQPRGFGKGRAGASLAAQSFTFKDSVIGQRGSWDL